NPSATYLAAKKVRHAVDAARALVATMLGAKPAEIIFTAGGTEANNLAIHGVLQGLPGKKIIVLATEHESILAAASQYPCYEAPVRSDGVVDIPAFGKLIDDDTVLVSVACANGEVGTIQPLQNIAQAINTVRIRRQQLGNALPLYLHTDATQAANYLDLHISR